MADTAIQPTWQSVGPTLTHEVRYTTHLRPSENTEINSVSGNSLKSKAASYRQHLQTRPSAQGQQSTLAASKLVRTLSNSATLKRGSSLPARSKLARFFHRFTWNKRSKAYLFGKSYLQRQPSFVVTPDRSTYSYSYKNHDLFKRKPKPKAWRSSRPVNFWKNSNPMELLKANGPVDLPASALSGNYEHTNNTSMAPVLENSSSSGIGSLPGNAGANGLTSGIDPVDRSGLRPKYESDPASRKMDSIFHTAQPLSDITSEMSQDRQPLVKISLPVRHGRSLSGTRDPNNTSSSGSTQHKRDSWINYLPQTPVNAASSSLLDKSSQINAERTQVPSRSLFSDGSTTPQAIAKTIESPAKSSTSLPSSYRPESWRRSAVIARNSTLLETDSDDSLEFVDAWSKYLRKAVAQRAVHSRQRKSTEIENEILWSRNLQWESEIESLDASSVRDFTSSKESLESGISSNSSSHSHNYSSYRNSKLAPLHSPRAMAAASRSLLNLAGDDATKDPDLRLFSNTVEQAPMRYAALFGTREGESLDTPWQPEHGTGSRSTSSESTTGYGKIFKSLKSDDVGESEKLQLRSFTLDFTPENEEERGAQEQEKRNITGEASKPHPIELDPMHSQLLKSTEIETTSIKESEFDFSDHSSSNKRPFPVSPVVTPPHSPIGNPSVERLVPSKSENAPTIIRNQAKWRQTGQPQKRVKSSVSKEHLLHSRQKTLESLWGAEDSDASVEAN